jgi:hypothetical protein
MAFKILSLDGGGSASNQHKAGKNYLFSAP